MLATALHQVDGPVRHSLPSRRRSRRRRSTEPLHALPIGRAEILRRGRRRRHPGPGLDGAPRRARRGCLAPGRHSRNRRQCPLRQAARSAADPRLSQRCRAIVTVEENVGAGGFGSAVLEFLASRGISLPVRTLAVPDRIFDHASQNRLREQAGLTSSSFVRPPSRFSINRRRVMPNLHTH